MVYRESSPNQFRSWPWSKRKEISHFGAVRNLSFFAVVFVHGSPTARQTSLAKLSLFGLPAAICFFYLAAERSLGWYTLLICFLIHGCPYSWLGLNSPREGIHGSFGVFSYFLAGTDPPIQGTRLYAAVVRILAPEVAEAGMTNLSNLGDLIEALLALDHRDSYKLPGWQVHEEAGDYVAHLCLGLERFRYCTRMASFDGIWSIADLEPHYLSAVADDESPTYSRQRSLRPLSARPKAVVKPRAKVLKKRK